MLKIILLIAILLTGALAFFPKRSPNPPDPDVFMKGLRCALCTATIDISVQYLALHPEPINDFVNDHLCQLFSEPAMKFFCNSMVYLFGDTVVQMVLNRTSSDDICQQLYFCENPRCRIRPTGVLSGHVYASPDYEPKAQVGDKKLDFDPWEFLKELIEYFTVRHLPLLDGDRDHFSTYPVLRGYYWRGKDCNDRDGNIYPGRRTNPYPGQDLDYDCNGIYGTDNDTGRPWKEVLCENTTRYGFAVIGDSVGAHFSIPPEYLTASKINATTFDNFLLNFANEFDLPHYSMTTGYMNDTKERPTRSLYKYFLERNRCNHRDLQNLAVNGGDTYDSDTNMRALQRNISTDYPMIVVMELIGNDVCFGPGKTTPPDVFKKGLLDRLAYLDTVLPKGSHVIMLGLVNGSLLYDYLHNETHPIGMTFRAVYDYLNCLEINPCPGWLNSNATIRHATTELAVELNHKYHEVMEEGRVYKNFDYTFYEFPAIEIMNKWVSQGGRPIDLIEPVDGFHCNQQFNALAADWLWESLKRDKPEWIGDINPNNKKIFDLFGDQGGYF